MMAELNCLFCGKQFEAHPVEVRRGRKYCSTECGYADKRKRSKPTCKNCGTEFEAMTCDVKRGKAKFCSRECFGIWSSNTFNGKQHWNYGKKFTDEHKCNMSAAQLGEKNSNWRGGKKIRKSGERCGYVEILVDGRYIQEHRLIAEKALGRKLTRNEVVHHFNGNKTDNRSQNLLVCTQSYHAWLERKMAHLYKQEHFALI